MLLVLVMSSALLLLFVFFDFSVFFGSVVACVSVVGAVCGGVVAVCRY